MSESNDDGYSAAVIEYVERFNDGVPFSMFNSEEALLSAIKKALRENKPIEEPLNVVT